MENQSFKVKEDQSPLTEKQKDLLNEMYKLIKGKSFYDVKKVLNTLEFNLDVKSTIN